MVALSRRLRKEPAPLGQPSIVATPERRPARWAVVSGLILYCSACWLLLWAVGTVGVDFVRAAVAAVR